MARTVADYESVAAAVLRLTEMGEKPTAGKVIAFVGGSKTTVLRHMRELAERTANGTADHYDTRGLVGELTEPMVTRIVAEARRLAREEIHKNLHLLTELYAGMAESLDELTRDLQTAVARAEAAEADLARLETEMDQRVEMEEHLAALSRVVQTLKGRPDTSPTLAAVRIVHELADGPDRKELHRRLSAAGYTDKEGHAARHRAVKSEYIEESGVPPRLHVTERGALWLATQIVRASRKAG